MRRILLLCLLALSGCETGISGPALPGSSLAGGLGLLPDDGTATQFRCGSSRVEFRAQAGGGDKAQLLVDGRAFALRQVAAASGARYGGGAGPDRVQFWNKGSEASLSVGDRVYPTCLVQASAQNTAQDAIQNAAQAAASDPGYRAAGNEPAWALRLTPGTLALQLDYGATRLETALPARQDIPGGYRYESRDGSRSLRVDVVRQACRDSMSGMSFPDTVTLQLDSRELRGCGGEPADLLLGAEWRVESIGGQAVGVNPAVGAAERGPSLLFAAEPEKARGRVSGSSGCNRYTGVYRLTGETLQLGPLAGTRMACLSQDMADLERRFLVAMEAVRGFEVAADGALRLTGPEGGPIVARRVAARRAD